MLASAVSSALLILALPSSASAARSGYAGWGCKAVKDGYSFDFKKLQGRHQVTSGYESWPTVTNTTWEINPCGALQRRKGTEKPCEPGTQICGTVRVHNLPENLTMLYEVISVAGNIGERAVDEKFERLGPANGDMGGLRVEFHGGKYEGIVQQAVVDFMCDMDREGTEGNEKSADDADDEKKGKDGDKKKEKDGKNGDEKKNERRDEKKDGDKKNWDPSLKFVSYEPPVDGKRTLKLEWKTRYACEGGNKGNHWGFFTWIFIILFLGTAAYLIAVSWMNYNTYGYRGLEILPHGDTLRDLPYLMKDFLRKIVGTLQGRASRGGYSAV